MSKLPADLPENWTQGQTISPNGTEVGLTEKHGYNYLMKQVNDTQTKVNNINTALTDVAQQATVDEINNKIGTESDADTQPTLFGRLAQLKNVLVEKLAELLTKVTGIDGKIGTSGDTAGSATLFRQVKDISEKMPTGAVKSIQNLNIDHVEANQTDSSFGNAKYKDFSISQVNINKTMIVGVNGRIDSSALGTKGEGMTARIVSNSTVRIYANFNSEAKYFVDKISLQIVEFL